MYRADTSMPIFDKESYNNINSIHKEMENELNKDIIDNEKMQKLYLKEMHNAMFLGGNFKRNYGAGTPY